MNTQTDSKMAPTQKAPAAKIEKIDPRSIGIASKGLCFNKV